jgi:probable DNA metabolism protein
MLSPHRELDLRIEFYKRSKYFKGGLVDKVLKQVDEKGFSYVLSNVSDEARELYRGSRAAGGECHQAKGFLRFQEQEKILLAKADFEHNIEDCLLRHFMDRFPMKKVVILSRGIAYVGQDGLISKENQERYLDLYVKPTEEKDPLWEVFYDSQHLETRRNRKLAMKAVPKKYWKRFNMPEAVKIDKGLPSCTIIDFI